MDNLWPSLEYSDWKATYETLHRWLQIVGKLRLCKSPRINHSWGSTFMSPVVDLRPRPFPWGIEILQLNLISYFINYIFQIVSAKISVSSFKMKVLLLSIHVSRNASRKWRSLLLIVQSLTSLSLPYPSELTLKNMLIVTGKLW